MDTACDLLENPDTAQSAPLREALTLMLYSRAMVACKKHADPATIDKLVTTINRLERRMPPTNYPKIHLSNHPDRTFTTRHHVELTVASASTTLSPKIIDLTTTQPQPPGATPCAARRRACPERASAPENQPTYHPFRNP